MKPFANAEVARAFEAYPAAARRKLLALRELIFETAAATDGVGELEETLKWSEPAYLTSRSGSGTTIRIAWKKSAPSQYAMYFNCQTTLVADFRELYPAELEFEGNRAIVFEQSDPLPRKILELCIAAALTYHRDKPAARSRKRARVFPAAGRR